MKKSIEITAKYFGERIHFDNADGSRTIIGAVVLTPESKDVVSDVDIDPDYPLTIKGQCEVDELQPNLTYRFFGGFQSYFNRRLGTREQQFHFRTFVQHVPRDRQGVIDYLAGAGKGNGVGPSKARKLVDHFGAEQVLLACRTEIEKVRQVANLNQHRAESLAAKLTQQAATEAATLEVDQLLHGRGFPRTLTNKLIKTWGNKAAENIHADPYSLMLFRGVGFRLTDKLYLALGNDPASLDRQALCLWHAMASDNDGHTWFPAAEPVRKLYRSIGGDSIDYKAAIRRGKEFGQLSDEHYGAIATLRTDKSRVIDSEGSELWLAEGKHAAAEQYVARSITERLTPDRGSTITRYASVEHTEQQVLEHATCARCRQQLTAPEVHVSSGKPYGPTCIGYVSDDYEVHDLADWLAKNPVVQRYVEELPDKIITVPGVSLWPDASLLAGCTDHQREKYSLATTSRIGILGGSPGTGKTFTLAEIIKAVHATGRVGYDQMAAAAPTGKAAVRLSEAFAANGVPLRARTTHSLLGVGDSDPDTGMWQFDHNEANPWPFKMMFFDEQSMTDIGMMANIFKAMPKHCHALFVGDVNQLSPVGNGAPFRDMIAAGLPYGELREIIRNSGGIVEACAAIRDEQPWTDSCDGFGNLVITNNRAPEAQVDELLYLLDETSDPIWSVQVLVAVNKSSKLSRAELNKTLQDKLNPNPAVDGTPFRNGDKVVCLKNGFFRSLLTIDDSDEEYSTNTAGEVYVANGELGVVDSIEDKTIQVKLENPQRFVQIPRGRQTESDNDNEGSSTGCAWDLGYALSVHKFQGSEQDNVFVLLDTYAGARMVCDRSWLYTAISRAKKKCYLIGLAHTAERFCRELKINNRRTMLDSRIKSLQFELEVAGL